MQENNSEALSESWGEEFGVKDSVSKVMAEY